MTQTTFTSKQRNWAGYAAAVIVSFLIMGAGDTALAQVNCNVLPHGQARANCYQAQARIYQQQAQQYNRIARQQYNTHRRIGQGLRLVPGIGNHAAPAWNAPRYYYDYRYGRPQR